MFSKNFEKSKPGAEGVRDNHIAESMYAVPPSG